MAAHRVQKFINAVPLPDVALVSAVAPGQPQLLISNTAQTTHKMRNCSAEGAEFAVREHLN